MRQGVKWSRHRKKAKGQIKSSTEKERESRKQTATLCYPQHIVHEDAVSLSILPHSTLLVFPTTTNIKVYSFVGFLLSGGVWYLHKKYKTYIMANLLPKCRFDEHKIWEKILPLLFFLSTSKTKQSRYFGITFFYSPNTFPFTFNQNKALFAFMITCFTKSFYLSQYHSAEWL